VTEILGNYFAGYIAIQHDDGMTCTAKSAPQLPTDGRLTRTG
jgi:hypothetical protein